MTSRRIRAVAMLGLAMFAASAAPPGRQSDDDDATWGSYGGDPGGTWRLFVVDNVGGDSGSISGSWTLTITTEDGNFSGTARAPITLVDNAAATPYASTITVPAIASPLIKVRVDVHDLSHTFAKIKNGSKAKLIEAK